MGTNALSVVPEAAQVAPMPAIMEAVLMAGDLADLKPAQRVSFYGAVCQSVGLNPMTKPFEYIKLNGKLTLYSTKNCTDQLRFIHNISVHKLTREVVDGILITTAAVKNGQGREDEDIGAVPFTGLQGEAKANALMKSTTKAKRRATLSICGLSFPDESEIDGIRGAQRVSVDMSTGELIEQAKQIEAGGHLIGTQAAADAVAERKIAEMQGKDTRSYAQRKRDEDTADAETRQPTGGKSADYYKMLEAFKGIKAQIGEEAYYRILGNNGYEKSSQIPDVSKGRAIYAEMMVCLKAKQSNEAERQAAAPKQDPQPAASMIDQQLADLDSKIEEAWPEGRE